FVTDNLRAILTQIDVESDAEKSSDNIQSSGGPISKKATSTVSLKWKADNPDKDELLYRLQYRLLGPYSWETSDLPEGPYRVRIVPSDELANPPDLTKKHELESSVVLLDNAPPSI